MPSFDSPQVVSQRRGSTVTHTPPSGRNGTSGRVSFSPNMRAPSFHQDPNTQSLTGISQILAVQEMAFRQGQHDAGVSRERIPTSPFAMHFNHVWAEFYAMGKECGGMPRSSSLSLTDAAANHNNFYWPVLINPYTQDLEHPNGVIDIKWVSNYLFSSLPSPSFPFTSLPLHKHPRLTSPSQVHKLCTMSLNCMEAIIRSICKRKGEWQRHTCDVPAHIRQALASFDDLRARYEKLKRNAHEARAGGLPAGYAE